MDLKRLLSLTRQAVDEYQLIQDRDHIAVGISGGKDSLTCLYALHGLKRFYEHPFTIEAVTVDLGLGMDFSPVKRLCEKLDVPYTIVNTDIARIVFEERKESNPCALCAKMRKGALNHAIGELGCNKIAYAHHKDDVVETMLLSLIYEGRFHTFAPMTFLEQTGLKLIRPLIYVKEADIVGFMHKMELPVVASNCPADGFTKREYVKDLLKQLNRENPGVKDRMFTAVKNSKLDDWLH